MKKVLIIMFFIVSYLLFSDSIDMDKIFDSKKEKFNKTKTEKVENYNKELEQKNEEFNKQLKESWETFSAKVEELGIGPKPKELPVIDKPTGFHESDPTPIMVPTEVTKEPEPIKAETISKKDYSFVNGYKTVSVIFFGDNISFKIPKRIPNLTLKKLSDGSISNAWEEYSKTEYIPFTNQLNDKVAYYKLNPWGIYKLVDSLGNRIFKINNDIVMFNAFIMTQLGQNCKISYANGKAYLLFPSKKPLYGKVYLNINGVKYYIIDDANRSLKSIKTYTADFPGVLKEFDLTVKKLPLLKESTRSKLLSFSYNGELNNVKVEYNATLVEFFKDYPQTHYENYFQSELFYKTKEDIIQGLKPLIIDKSEAEAVNIILHFVQKSFEYKTDQEQFKREKPLFPEETIHYNYSDCEDRSVLFSYLVKEILGLKVIGLKYNGHMATAVLLKKPIGDTISYNGKKFTIADPTYINANIGNSMPSFKNSNPEIIGVN